jgi:apolipoprotein N-acyltransferase
VSRRWAKPPLSGAHPSRSVALVVGSAALAGTLVLLSFPPFGQGWLMWVALTPLFAIHHQLRPRALLAYGYLLAVVPIAVIAFSVVPSSAIAAAAYATTVPLAFALGIVAATKIESRLLAQDHGLASLAVFPAFAVTVELLLGTETVGVPVTIALTQTDYPLLIQNADLVGTAGTTFLLVLANRSWPLLWATAKARASRSSRAWAPPRRAVAAVGVLLANLLYGAWAVHRYGYDDASVAIATIQPAIPTADYVNRLLDPAAQERIDRRLADLVRRAVARKPSLLVLSEGGNGRYNFRIPALRRRLEETARRARAGFVVSSLDLDPAGDEYNALFSLDRHGRLLGTHRKRLLTPVGEGYLHRGPASRPLPSAIGPLGAMVCFESCFPSIARRLVTQGAQYLLVSTSDASFRNSALPLLHARFSVFRAIETRRYLVQAANTGPSLVIRPTGTVGAATGFLDRDVLSGKVAPRTGATLFVRLGPVGARALIVWLAMVSLRAVRPRRRLPRPAARPEAVAGPAPVYAASLTAYAALVALLAGASVGLATAGTVQDRGVLRNVATFLAPPPQGSMRALSRAYLQRAPNTCGPAALAFLLKTYGFDVDQGRVARWVRLEERGTTMLDLVRAARHLGLRAWGEQVNLEALRRDPTPTIAYLLHPGHFVVVVKVAGGWVYYFDPTTGPVRVRDVEFLRVWSGYTLLVRFAPIPEIDGGPRSSFRTADASRASTTSRGGSPFGLTDTTAPEANQRFARLPR